MIISQPAQGIADLVARGCGLPAGSWKDYSTLGLIRSGVFVAGCVYHRWSDGDVCVNIAAWERNWLNREYLFAIFDYPFNQAGCRRITALVDSNNFKSKRFVQSLGFREEGRLRKGTKTGDLLVFGMLKEECKWLSIKLKKAA